MQSTTNAFIRSKPPAWPAPSHITVLVRNLKLLQFDRRPDWPNITVRTFGSSQQDLRQRIKAVEWSLYHLFMIWDAEGTQNKLRPFFPPLEPLQSINLRAALFRALSDLKKNGVLGREAILRKTMLDECKGEKFEEVLAIFSTVVLRKIIAKRGPNNAALDVSMKSSIDAAEQDMLFPMILAHRVSLSATKGDKSQIQAAYDDLSQLLKLKTDELDTRSQNIVQLPPDDAQGFQDVSEDIKKMWYGSEDWADTILSGGRQLHTDFVLDLPFPQTWSLAKKGKLKDLGAGTSSDLLADLDGRISRQKLRLQRWREFKLSLNKEKERLQSPKAQDSPGKLLFREHQTLTVASIAQSSPDTQYELDSEHSSLIASLNEALSKHKGQASQNDEVTAQIPEIPTIREDDFESSVQDQIEANEVLRYGIPSRASTKVRELQPESYRADKADTEVSTYPEPPLGSTEASPLPDSHIPINLQPTDSGPSPQIHISRPDRVERRGTNALIERTRQSMSFLPAPAPSSGPRHSSSHRPRRSEIFPVNQFETPTKAASSAPPGEHKSGSGTLTPQEELFSQDVDYAKVFKSRPRIALSPVNSPCPDGDEDFGEIDEEGER
ncbi:hypothetical protein AJ80_03737 [Polytolypa hystricis UAMH7299]|uniref:HAUS augmin-like complex subunit 6 N-terminal domain-containing protein n=1 Tax=Polytolypa hystricis (strain UAMH7299) TaxID=1447883 RepID=A0A2B7YHJ3_POLH7|nr:hypothetical protein AJ80_03737 [Polytolypa hystricis UAMH7299]